VTVKTFIMLQNIFFFQINAVLLNFQLKKKFWISLDKI